jgi:hypothetical protein
MSLTEKDRKFQTKSGNSFPPGSATPSGPAFAAAIAAALTRAYGGRHSAVKVVAGAVGANERAVRNWFEAKNGPSGEHLLRLISHSDEMLDSVLTMAGKKEITAGVQIAIARAALERALAEVAKLEAGTIDRRQET